MSWAIWYRHGSSAGHVAISQLFLMFVRSFLWLFPLDMLSIPIRYVIDSLLFSASLAFQLSSDFNYTIKRVT